MEEPENTKLDATAESQFAAVKTPPSRPTSSMDDSSLSMASFFKLLSHSLAGSTSAEDLTSRHIGFKITDTEVFG